MSNPSFLELCKIFSDEFVLKKSVGAIASGNSNIYQSELDSKDIYPKKYLWLIHNITSQPRKSSFLLSDVNNKLSIEFQSVHSVRGGTVSSCEFKLYRSTHTEEMSPSIFDKTRTRLTILTQATDAPLIRSDWIPCNTSTTITFDNSNVVPYILVPSKLIPTIPFHGQTYKDLIMVGVDFDFIYQANPPVLDPENPAEHSHLIMQKMYDKRELADVEICIKNTLEDGTEVRKQIKAHKSVLMANSPVFEAMLGPNFLEDQLSSIEIVDFTPEIVRQLLHYFYTGKADCEKYALDLLKISDKYDVQELVNHCQKYISMHIPKFGWDCIFELLQIYGTRIPLLKELVRQYYRRYEDTLRKSENFQAAVKSFPDVFVDIYCSEK